MSCISCIGSPITVTSSEMQKSSSSMDIRDTWKDLDSNFKVFLLLQLVVQCLEYFPRVNLSANISPITRTVLQVQLFLQFVGFYLKVIETRTDVGTSAGPAVFHDDIISLVDFDVYHLVQVALTITPEFIWKDKVHGSSERWWIWVEVSASLLHLTSSRHVVFVSTNCYHLI